MMANLPLVATVPNLSIKLPDRNFPFKEVVPHLGQDNIKILKNMGLNKKQIGELKKKRII